MKTLLIAITCILILAVTHSEAQPQGGPVQIKEAIGIIKGRVLDKSSDGPIPYSNVIVYTQRDSSYVTGTITNEDGTFMIDKVPFGKFYIEIKFIGYQREILSQVMITPDNSEVLLKDIMLSESSKQLDEVTVTAERSLIEYRIDKKVIRVSENLNSMGGSAAQALATVPSITVDVDGNVMLRGSSNFTVLIDGKPSPLEGSDALRQIPASAVENIEVITNPSAKYDPDGLSGIINIITKKRALDGISGIVNASIGTGDKYRGDFLVNYKNDKLSFFAGADYTDETRNGEREISQSSTQNDTTSYVVHTGDSPFNRSGFTVKSGIGYKLNAKNTLSLEGNYGYANFSRSSTEYFKEYTLPSSVDSYYLLDQSDSRYEDFYSVNLNYEKTFNNKDHKLNSYIYYSKEWGGSNEYINQYITDNNWNINDPDPYLIFAEEPGRESELRFQADYTKPLGKDGKLEAGYQLRNEQEKESYYFNEWDSSMNDWVDNPLFSNSLVFINNIQALYGTFANKVLGFEYQVGLRGEYTYRSVKNSQSDQPSVLELFDYFPSVHISRKIGEQDQAAVSYSRRIRRPNGRDLDPFVSYMSPNMVRVGNPDLLPEYVDSYEINYQKGFGKSWISLETYYRLTHDAMTRVTNITEDGTRVLTMDNLNEETALGAELMFNFMVNEWLNFNVSGNIYQFKLNGTMTDTEVASSSTNYDSRFNFNFKLSPTTRFQVQGNYQGPSVTAQGQREQFFMASAALKQDFFKEKLTATLQMQDIFGTASFNFTNEGADFKDTIHMKRESQVVRLTLGFRINNYKKQNGNKQGNGDGGNGMDQESDY